MTPSSLTYFLAKNSTNSAKSNRIFPGKRTRDRALILTYLDSSMAEGYLDYYVFFQFRPSSGGNLGSKEQTSDPSLFHKNPSTSICSYLLEYCLWWKFWQIWTIFRGVRTQKPPNKGHSMDAESVRKTLKAFNLTTTNAILMKLTAIMYLH